MWTWQWEFFGAGVFTHPVSTFSEKHFHIFRIQWLFPAEHGRKALKSGKVGVSLFIHSCGIQQSLSSSLNSSAWRFTPLVRCRLSRAIIDIVAACAVVILSLSTWYFWHHAQNKRKSLSSTRVAVSSDVQWRISSHYPSIVPVDCYRSHVITTKFTTKSL